LIDTGGWSGKETDFISKAIEKQIKEAISEADLILVMVDAKVGSLFLDREIAKIILRSQRPFILVCNKADNVEQEYTMSDFYSLGLGEPLPVSAFHGRNIDVLLEKIIKEISSLGLKTPQVDLEPESQSEACEIAVIGRPNVGKSSYINAVLKYSRMIVHEVAGTTRDVVPVQFSLKGKNYVFMDTAGIRRRRKIKDDLEKGSVSRALKAARYAKTVVFILDGTEGITRQDKRILEKLSDLKKGCVIAVNKWDLVKEKKFIKIPKFFYSGEKDIHLEKRYSEYIKNALPFYNFCPVVFISCKTRSNIYKPLEQAGFIIKQQQQRIETSKLNKIMKHILETYSPPSVRGKRLKIFYAAQTSCAPVEFTIFMNKKSLMNEAYIRYLISNLKEKAGFDLTPISVTFKEKEKFVDRKKIRPKSTIARSSRLKAQSEKR
jgi:GTP-binding protein